MNKGAKKFVKIDKPRDTFLKPEEVDPTKAIYAFSYNPLAQPSSQKDGLLTWFNVMTNLFEQCTNAYFHLYVEISSTGRFHFHGQITVNKVYEFYTIDIKSLMLNGTSCMKKIDLTDLGWEDYIYKQQKFMQPALQKYLIGPLEDRQGNIEIDTYKSLASDTPDTEVNQLKRKIKHNAK